MYNLPVKSFKKVVLPAPFAPTKATLESISTPKLIFFNKIFSGLYPNPPSSIFNKGGRLKFN